MEKLFLWRNTRDITLFCLAIAWLCVSIFPPEYAKTDTFMLFGILRYKGYFLYDFVNKFGALLAGTMLMIPNKTVWIRVMIPALFADFTYEICDLIYTNDEGTIAGLIFQNSAVGLTFLWGLFKEYRDKTWQLISL